MKKGRDGKGTFADLNRSAAILAASKPPVRTAGESRSAAVRRYRIHKIFLRDRFTNCTRLASELEVGVRTVLRDIEVMRTQDFPIDYDVVRRAYFYSEPVFNLPSVQISKSSLLAIRTAAGALGQCQCVRMQRQLNRIFHLLLSGVTRCGGSSMSSVEDPLLSFYISNVCPVNSDTLECVQTAIAQRAEIEFEYRKPAALKPQRYRAWPYFLSNRDGAMYLIARDCRDVRTKSFVVARMTGEVRHTGCVFSERSRGSVERHFRNAFRVFGGPAVHRVCIRVAPVAVPYMIERLWHPSQQFECLHDGGAIIRLAVADLRDVRSWVLRWGPDVEVLAPAVLRRTVATALAAAARLYETSVESDATAETVSDADE